MGRAFGAEILRYAQDDRNGRNGRFERCCALDDRNGRKARLERCEGKAAKEWYHIAVASAPVAQGIEQLPSKQLAVGSNPTGGANSY